MTSHNERGYLNFPSFIQRCSYKQRRSNNKNEKIKSEAKHKAKRKSRTFTNLCDAMKIKYVVGCSKNETCCMGTYWNKSADHAHPNISKKISSFQFLWVCYCLKNILSNSICDLSLPLPSLTLKKWLKTSLNFWNQVRHSGQLIILDLSFPPYSQILKISAWQQRWAKNSMKVFASSWLQVEGGF